MKSKFTALIFVISLLSACGGGGGGGGGGNTTPTNSSSSSTAAVTLAANAGADITVNEGERVNLNPNAIVVNPTGFKAGSGKLEITGSSTKASDIVKLVWTQKEGAATGFSTTDTTSGKFFFTAADTGTADSVQIIYELTLTNAAGQSAADSITITINRVNEAPVANAGSDQSAESETQISLSGTTSTDPDGSIKSYAWSQVSGDSITLTDADKATATFTAPSVNEAKTYEFELTVTDNNDVAAKDKILVTITPKDAPLVDIYFPTPVGVYKETTISAFGSAEAVVGNLSKIEVGTGGEFTEVAFNENGEWRLDNLVVPETDTFEIIVKVTDSLGKISVKKSRLKKSGEQGAGKTWTKVYAIGADSESNRLFVFAKTGTLPAGIRVHAIDLNTGIRADEVSNFSVSSQGVSSTAIGGARYNPATKTFYASISPSIGDKQIIGINVISGQRTVISDTNNGSGVSFTNPTGIAFNNQGQLFVADNGGKIIRVEPTTGTRTEIANTSTQIYSVNFAVDAVLDPTMQNNLFVLPKLTNSAVLKLSLDVNPVSSALITNSATTSQGPAINLAEQMEIDKTLDKLFLVAGDRQLFEANITNGTRSLITGVTANGMGYDHSRHLLFFNDNGKNAIWVLDPISKHKVMISGSVD